MVTAVPFGRTDAPATEPAPLAIPVASPRFAAAGDGQDLLTQAKAGDQAAFAALIRRHQNMVFSLAFHMLRSRPAAEDLAQEVFLKLYRGLQRLESEAHLVAWLRRVTSHQCINEIRRRNHRQEFGTDTLPDTGQAPELRDVFVAERLEALVAGLPEQARMVVVLRYQEDMPLAEIADVLSMPVNTVKSHLRRSIVALRERLTGKGQ